MTIDIKENALIFRKAVKNCNSTDAMIVTLIPFLLAAKLDSPDLLTFKHGTEVTYLLQNHATTRHFDDNNAVDMNFYLSSLMRCQNSNASIFCHFDDVIVNSVPKNRPKPRMDIIKDSWTRNTLLHSFIEIVYEKNGEGVVWIPAEVQPIGRTMLNTLARLLIVGMDLSMKPAGSYETPSNVSMGICKTKYFATRTQAMNRRDSDMNLFLIPRPEDSLDKPLKVAQILEPNECQHKSQALWYSFWAGRELRRADPKDVDTEINSAENLIVMNHHNFTSFSKIRTTIKNHEDNTKYIIDESISLSLQDINAPVCPHCDNDDSNSQEHNSSERKNVFFG